MPLFDFITKKVSCSICGTERNNLFGGMSKLSDGKICKECKRKLSDYFSLSENVSTAQVKAHLEYRERNKAEIAAFKDTASVEGETGILIVDESAQKFIISPSKNFSASNAGDFRIPDVFKISDITSVELFIHKTSQEQSIYNTEDKRVKPSGASSPYIIKYTFSASINLNVDFVKNISFTLASNVSENSFSKCRACVDKLMRIMPLLGKKDDDTLKNDREMRNRLIDKFHASKSISFADGNVLVDTKQKCFVISETADPRGASDVMMISDIVSMDVVSIPCMLELKTKNEEGQTVSFNPPRYEKSMWYACVIYLKNSWTNQINLRITGQAVPENMTLSYREKIVDLFSALGQDTDRFSDVYFESMINQMKVFKDTLMNL